MAIKIKTVTAKNFLSIGNVTQAINFDRQDLTLVLGVNIDLGGDDSGARNGTGKTTIVNALSYSLYGAALSNIRKDNLINRTNGKNMLVTIEFEKNGIEYKIERGRKPNLLKFYVGGVEREYTDEAQGDSRETQADIERVLMMSHDMFKHIVALNTYTEPFLNLKANDQRTIIEQLLGITLLSEKSEQLKELARATKDLISQEEYRIKAVNDANKRIQEQIESLERRQRLWLAKKAEDIEKFKDELDKLQTIDIDKEIESHKLLVSWNERWNKDQELRSAIKNEQLKYDQYVKTKSKLEKEILDLKEHKCYACGQKLHNTKQTEIINNKLNMLEEVDTNVKETATRLLELNAALVELGEVGPAPKTYYDRFEHALRHKNTIENLTQKLDSKIKDEDPYKEQILEMHSKGLEEVNYEQLNELAKLRDHQEFLLKLLTSKDSFIRKTIIDQNLSYLNSRLSYYLDRIGLPHTVIFQNDLSVNITELGRELDFDNLSRGERNRLILSLSLAFRDVWESLYQPINLLFIDEVMDSGMDSSGVENGLAILKKISRERNKSVFLVSHKDELASRVNNILTVTKENGFTQYSTDVEVI